MDVERGVLVRNASRPLMALIVWKRKVRLQLKEQLEYARLEFGLLTARRWVEQLQMFEKRVEEYPASFTPVHELKDETIQYRGCTVIPYSWF